MKEIRIAMFGLFFLLLVSFSVSATAPTTPTISPASGSVFLSYPELTCSASTDPDGDDINYYYYTNKTIINDPIGGWTSSANINNFGYIENASSQIHANISCIGAAGKEECYVWDTDVYFFNDSLEMRIKIVEDSARMDWARIFIDDVIVYTTASGVAWSNLSIDTSSFNNGTDINHTLKFGIFYQQLAATHRFDWTYNTTLTDQNALLHNTSNTTYSSVLPNSGASYAWNCQACDNTSACSAFTSSNLFSIATFYSCEADNLNLALNFTLRDEENESLFIGEFDFGGTLSTDIDSLNFGFNQSNGNNYSYCLSPAGATVDLTATIEYLFNSTAYTFPRQYYFQDSSITGGSQQNIILYSLLDSLSTAVTFSTIRGGQYISNIIIHLQRYDVATDSYKLVGMGKTSASGTDIIYLRLTDAFYRVLAIENGNNVFDGGAQHITSSSYVIDLGGGTGGGFTNYSGIYTNFNNIIYNLYYNNNTGNVVLTYDAPSGYTTSNCLKLDQYDSLNGTTNVCYDCLSSSSGTISCSIPDNSSYYVAKYIVYNGDIWSSLQQIGIDLKANISDLIGKDGAFISFIFLGVIAFIAIFSAVAAMLMTIFGFGILVLIGLIPISWTTAMMVIVAGGIILFKLSKK